VDPAYGDGGQGAVGLRMDAVGDQHGASPRIEYDRLYRRETKTKYAAARAKLNGHHIAA
jgi:hypothetical protein